MRAYKSFCMETPELVMAELNLSPFSGIELLAGSGSIPRMLWSLSLAPSERTRTSSKP